MMDLALSLAEEFNGRLERAEGYLDECVAVSCEVDVVTLRRLLRGLSSGESASDVRRIGEPTI